jgi:hypothetical protein
MKDKPNEEVQVIDDDEDQRPKSVVRSPWPVGYKPIGPAGAPPKNPVPPVILGVLEDAQARIDKIQQEQLRRGGVKLVVCCRGSSESEDSGCDSRGH